MLNHTLQDYRCHNNLRARVFGLHLRAPDALTADLAFLDDLGDGHTIHHCPLVHKS